ncbi:DNA-binding protein [Hymenopellis radicata]|nr:DNA-binding protein [Hymenopellis radicata]
MSQNHNLTYNQAVHGITGFIEVAIHTILYIRHIYPADLFVRRRIYDTPSTTVADELLLGNVDKVVVIIKDKDHVPHERFIFAVQTMVKDIETFDKDVSFDDSITTAALGKFFRASLVKLNMIENQLGRLNLGDDASFAVVLELKDNRAPSVKVDDEPPPWIPAEVSHTTANVPETAEISVLRAVNTGIINLTMAVQESEAKLQRQKA